MILRLGGIASDGKGTGDEVGRTASKKFYTSKLRVYNGHTYQNSYSAVKSMDHKCHPTKYSLEQVIYDYYK